jgi:hypothetical protein
MPVLLSRLRDIAKRSIFGLVALPVATGMGVYLKCQGADLQPHGIIGLELAFTAINAGAIVETWAGPKHDVAVNQVLLDYIFIAGYTCSLIFICLNAADRARLRGRSDLANAAEFAALGALLAGALDCIENIGLLLTLTRPISTLVVLVTSLTATAKFALVAIALAIVPVAAFWPSRRRALG